MHSNVEETKSNSKRISISIDKENGLYPAPSPYVHRTESVCRYSTVYDCTDVLTFLKGTYTPIYYCVLTETVVCIDVLAHVHTRIQASTAIVHQCANPKARARREPWGGGEQVRRFHGYRAGAGMRGRGGGVKGPHGLVPLSAGRLPTFVFPLHACSLSRSAPPSAGRAIRTRALVPSLAPL